MRSVRYVGYVSSPRPFVGVCFTPKQTAQKLLLLLSTELLFISLQTVYGVLMLIQVGLHIIQVLIFYSTCCRCRCYL